MASANQGFCAEGMRMIGKRNQGLELINLVCDTLCRAVARPISLTKLKNKGKCRADARISAPLFE
jgi:hypothetical protein